VRAWEVMRMDLRAMTKICHENYKFASQLILHILEFKIRILFEISMSTESRVRRCRVEAALFELGVPVSAGAGILDDFQSVHIAAIQDRQQDQV
jgi:hypothetical protein